MEDSYLMSRGKALETFPMLKREGLVGAVVYYDGTSLCNADDPMAGLLIVLQDNIMTHA